MMVMVTTHILIAEQGNSRRQLCPSPVYPKETTWREHVKLIQWILQRGRGNRKITLWQAFTRHVLKATRLSLLLLLFVTRYIGTTPRNITALTRLSLLIISGSSAGHVPADTPSSVAAPARSTRNSFMAAEEGIRRATTNTRFHRGRTQDRETNVLRLDFTKERGTVWTSPNGE